MNRAWRLRLGGGTLGFISLLATPALAGLVHYYYDAQGRLLGVTSSGNTQRTSRIDNADNAIYARQQPGVTDPGTDTLPLKGVLIADGTLVSSDGRFTFVIQEDGNAVVYEGSTALWNSSTSGKQPGFLILNADGNLYFYGPDEKVLWSEVISNGTATGAKLVMQSDGNLVLYQNAAAVWSTGTGGH